MSDQYNLFTKIIKRLHKKSKSLKDIYNDLYSIWLFKQKIKKNVHLFKKTVDYIWLVKIIIMFLFFFPMLFTNLYSSTTILINEFHNLWLFYSLTTLRDYCSYSLHIQKQKYFF